MRLVCPIDSHQNSLKNEIVKVYFNLSTQNIEKPKQVLNHFGFYELFIYLMASNIGQNQTYGKEYFFIIGRLGCIILFQLSRGLR